MLRQLRTSAVLAYRTCPNLARNAVFPRRLLNTEAKYAEKLRQAAESRGLTVEELRAQVKEAELKRRREAAASPPPPPPRNPAAPPPQQSASSSDASKPVSPRTTRHDNSPVKPLNSIFNIARLLDTPHTAEQVSALWTAYHQTRSGGTGRGYLCAAVPVDAYEALLAAGRRFPTFILPLSRGPAPDAPADSNQQAYEFFLLQWAQYHSPPVPTYESETSPFPLPSISGETNPPTSTVIFAPLAEYKLRQDFAAPQLVLTFHTELAKTHGIVLLRGELTPTGTHDAEGNVKYWLTQDDAQLLAMNLQRFYLWQGKGTDERQKLLTAFHERPAEFNWEDLLKHAQPI